MGAGNSLPSVFIFLSLSVNPVLSLTRSSLWGFQWAVCLATRHLTLEVTPEESSVADLTSVLFAVILNFPDDSPIIWLAI